jgi:D-alanyl-D-alanine carboxypeptidase
VSLAAIVAFLAVTTDPADARSRRKRVKKHHVSQSYNPPYAAIVVDSKSGSTLHQSSPDSPRHPASLTKIMTLYMLFERLEAGKMKLDTPMDVSAEASRQAPTKLGLRPGQSLLVEEAIKGLVTKSANDAAVVVAEALAGSEEEFARQMTRKARALGMSNTLYRNASGLPDPEQVTTARDQARLGQAIQERFPHYYRYFSTSSFTYRGNAMRNHNKLLGRVQGVDGIKTGYTRASGFNLVTSVRRSDRHIIAVVLGGRSGASRDARMRSLIEDTIMEASVKRTTTRIAEAPAAAPSAPAAPLSIAAPAAAPVAIPAAPVVAAAGPVAAPAPAVPAAPAPAKSKLAAAASVPVTLSAPKAAAGANAAAHPADATATIKNPSVGSTEPIKPNLVKTVMVKLATKSAVETPVKAAVPVQPAKPAGVQVTNSIPMSAPAAKPAPVPVETPAPVAVQPETPAPAARPAPVQTAALPQVAPAPAPQPAAPAPVAAAAPPSPAPTGAKPGVLGVLPVAVASAGNAFVPSASAAEAKPLSGAKPASARSGWAIQIGAFEEEGEAKERLSAARSKVAGVLKKADPYTERTRKGEKVYFRARFAGFDRDQAEAACKQLKRSDISCMALKI